MMDAVGDLDFDGYVTLNGAHCFTANHEDIYKGCVPQEDIERLIQYQHDHPEMPFGFFPFNSSYSSGFIMPTYGDEMNRGFYFQTNIVGHLMMILDCHVYTIFP